MLPTIGFITCETYTDPAFDIWTGVSDAAKENSINLLTFSGSELLSSLRHIGCLHSWCR